MMMKTKGTFQLFAAAALLALGANAAQAAQIAPHDSGDATHELRVMNNSTVSVSVWVQDAAGRMHKLSNVAKDETETMEVPADVAAAGAFRIKVLPNAPAWAPWTTGAGMRTNDLTLPEGAAINLWLQEDLRDSIVEIPQR